MNTYSYYVRIKSIEMTNFRNIEHGIINFSNSDCESLENEEGSICGLYGQNGSGKSSVLMAINIMKEAFSGNTLDYGLFQSCIRENSDSCKIDYVLSIYNQHYDDELDKGNIKKAEVGYSISIKKVTIDGKNELHIFNEVLKAKIIKKDNTVIPMKTYFKTGDLEVEHTTYLNSFKKYVNGWNNFAKASFENSLKEKHDKQSSFIFCHGLGLDAEVRDKRDEYLKKHNDKYLEYTKILANSDHIDWFDGIENEEKRIHREAWNNQLKMLNESIKTISYYELCNFSVKEDEIKLLDEIIDAFNAEATMNNGMIQIITTKNLGDTNYGNKLPLYVSECDTAYLGFDDTALDYCDEDDLYGSYLFNLDLKENTMSHTSVYTLMSIDAQLQYLNDLIQSIIPGLNIFIDINNEKICKTLDLLRDKDGDIDFDYLLEDDSAINNAYEKHPDDYVYLFEPMDIEYTIVSNRDNHKIPLLYESDGVRRIISICSLLAYAYNNPGVILAIDEFDAGIFEFLLGEIVEVLDESAKGQIIFTSHNLRPLEVLRPKNVYFTTTDPKNRFVRITNLSGNNNLRSCYYRNIILGGKDELYKKTDRFDIKNALYRESMW